MDWDKEWKKISETKFTQTSLDKDAIMTAIQKESNMPLAKLKNNLKYKVYWIIFFVALLAILMGIFHANINMVLTLGFMLVWYLAGLVYVNHQYKSLKQLDTDMSANIHGVLKNYRAKVRAALRFEEIWGTAFFPIALLCGLVLPLFYHGMTFIEIIQDAKIMLVALGLIIVIIPLAIFASKAMNQKAFDQYLGQVEKNLQKLEELE